MVANNHTQTGKRNRRDKPSVVIIGAGMTGILLAIKMHVV